MLMAYPKKTLRNFKEAWLRKIQLAGGVIILPFLSAHQTKSVCWNPLLSRPILLLLNIISG
jgi:hypothetical protein